MKALIKVIWFSLVLTFGDNVLKFVEIDSTNLSQKLITAVPYLEVLNISKFLEGITNNINNVLFFTLLFLGLDLIGGEMNGIIKGPKFSSSDTVEINNRKIRITLLRKEPLHMFFLA